MLDVAAVLDRAVQEGERRPIHRRPYKRVKPIPRRPSRLDPHRGAIQGWLDVEPAITAIDLLARLKARDPDRFAGTHLRTVQRAVKIWRDEQAKRVVRCGTEALGAVTAAATVAPGPSPWAHGDGPGTDELGSIRR